MLTGIAPSVELTGGPWFTDNELDVELVETLKKVVRKFLHQKVRPPVPRVTAHVTELCPARAQSQPPSVTFTDPSTSEPVKIKPIYPVSATPFLPTSIQVLEFISKSGAAIVDLTKEHVEDLLDLMVFDGDVEKVLVNRLGADGLPVENPKRNKGKGTASSKRKKGNASSSEEEADSSDEGGASGRKSKSKSKKTSKRAANGKPKKKRAKRGSSDDEEDEESSDFDSDAEAVTSSKRKRAAGSGADDDDDGNGSASDGGGKKKSSKRRKKRVKSRVKREDGDDSDSSASEDDSRRKAANGDDGAAAGGAADGGNENTQYVYRMIRQYRPTVGWTDMPCGRCPVEEFCSEPPRRRAEVFRRPAQLGVKGGPSTHIELEGGIKGIGMLGGAGAAIGVSDAKWGELKGGIGNGVAPVNPIDCPAYKAWLDF